MGGGNGIFAGLSPKKKKVPKKLKQFRFPSIQKHNVASLFLLVSVSFDQLWYCLQSSQNQTEVLKEDLESKNHELNSTTANTQNSYGETQMIFIK